MSHAIRHRKSTKTQSDAAKSRRFNVESVDDYIQREIESAQAEEREMARIEREFGQDD